jgi:hypothetical protein
MTELSGPGADRPPRAGRSSGTGRNREHLGDPVVRANALEWSVAAMNEATGRLSKVQVDDRPRALAAIGEAVWWTITVDAMLVRHRRDGYEAELAARPAVERRRTEATLAGLRFVWNRIGRDTELAKLIQGAGAGPGDRRVTDWTWKPAKMPALGRLRARGEAWEVTRYRAYQAQLAGHSIGEAFTRTVPFLIAAGVDTAPGHDAAGPMG